MNFFDHKDLGNHLLQLCPKVVKHPVYIYIDGATVPNGLGPQNYRFFRSHSHTTLGTTILLLKFFLTLYKVIPRLTKIIRSGITFVSRNVISRYVIRRLTSRCLELKKPSRLGGSPLCDVASSFLCHKHTDGKDKHLEWPDRSCLLLYVSALIH